MMQIRSCKSKLELEKFKKELEHCKKVCGREIKVFYIDECTKIAPLPIEKLDSNWAKEDFDNCISKAFKGGKRR